MLYAPPPLPLEEFAQCPSVVPKSVYASTLIIHVNQRNRNVKRVVSNKTKTGPLGRLNKGKLEKIKYH